VVIRKKKYMGVKKGANELKQQHGGEEYEGVSQLPRGVNRNRGEETKLPKKKEKGTERKNGMNAVDSTKPWGQKRGY